MKFCGSPSAVLWWLVVVCLTPASQAAPWLDVFTDEVTGGEGVAWTSAQLPDGRLLFGFNSVVEFDGSRWRSHPVKGALSVRTIAPAPDGRVWIGAFNEIGFLQPDGTRYTYHSLVPQLPSAVRASLGDVWHVFAEGDGAVFVAQQDVIRWSGSAFTHWRLAGGRRLAAFQNAGRIFIAHQPTGLYELRADGPQRIVAAEAIGSAGLLWRGPVAGRMILATTQGLVEEHEGRFEPFRPELDRWIHQNVLASVHPLRSGGLAIGTLHGGLRIVPPDESPVQAHDVTTGLPTEGVYSIFEDREGLLWLTSPAGLARLQPDPRLGVYRLAEAVPPAALGRLGDDIVVGTSNGLFRINPDHTRDRAPLSALPLPQRHVYALAQEEGSLVVAHRRGLDRLHPDGTLETLHDSGLDTPAVARAVNGNAYYAAENRRLWRLENGIEAKPVGDLRDLTVALVPRREGDAILATATQGLRWIGSATSGANLNAVAEFDQETGPTYAGRLSNDEVVAARGRRVALLQLEPTVTRRAHHLLPEGFRSTALLTEGDETWLAGEHVFATGARRNVIYRLQWTGAAWTFQPLVHPLLQRTGAIRALLVERTAADQRLWVAGSSSILQLPLTGLEADPRPPAPLLRVVTPVGPPATTYSLPYDNHRLQVEIARPDPTGGAGWLVQTRLAGKTSDWDEAQERTELTLENLRHGEHELLVRFVTAAGDTSEPSRIAFRVLPPWWLSRWAVVSGLVLVLGTTWAAGRFRLARLRQRAARLERLVQERTAELTHANQAKTEFVARMSHELRNPLNGIVASAHALQERGLRDDQRDLIATMRHCADLLDRLIGDVLDFSEVETGRVVLQSSVYDPVELAARAVTMVDPVARRKGLELELDVAADAPESLRGDPARVQQVVLNLLGNAVKFSERGRIILRLAASPAPAEGLLFTVTDDGPGIPAAEREHLFEQFARTQEARDRRIPGNGLGLAVARQLVESMGGRIWLDPEVQRGARFCVHLPLDLGDSAKTGTLDQPEPAPATYFPTSALVIEDLDYNARAMAALLGRHGCRVRSAPDGATALRLLRTERFEAVFLDVDLPDISGIDLARRILESDQTHAPRLLIATTAYADDAVRESCAAAGLHGFLTKPVTPQKLRQVLAQAARASLPAPPMDLPAAVERAGLDMRLLRVIAPEPEDLRRQAGRLQGLLQADLRELVRLAERQDLAAMPSAAHRILSHARFIGATQLAALADEVERGARAASPDTLDLVAALAMEVERVGRELAVLAQ